MRQAAECLLVLTPCVLVTWAIAELTDWAWVLFWDGVMLALVGMFALGTYLLRDEEPPKPGRKRG